MKSRRLWLLSLLCVAVVAAAQSPMRLQVGETEVSVEFYTSSIVRVTKHPVGSMFAGGNLVVTAQPEAVEVSRNGSTFSSKTLMVKVDPKTGAITPKKTIPLKGGTCRVTDLCQGKIIWIKNI